MSREIKFRAFYSWPDNRMFYCGDLKFGQMEDEGQALSIFLCDKLVLGTSNPVFIMQYTGLKDKNGKEIYEGDIIKYSLIRDGTDLSHHTYFKEKSRIGIVLFGDGTSGVVETSKEYFRGYTGYLLPFQLYTRQENVQIIGNIYENPELLNK